MHIKHMKFSVLLSYSFLSVFLILLFEQARRTFLSFYKDKGHSWVDYIYSPPTLYDDSKPCEILEFISVFSFQNLPILPFGNL